MPEYKYRISADTNSAQQATQQLADKTASLDDLMVKGEKAANEYAAAAGATAKQISAFGKANELTAGEVKKLIEAGSLAKEEVGKLGQAELDAAKHTKSLKDSSAETSNAITGMAGAMQTAIAVFGAAQLGKTAVELYQIGTANERVRESADKLTGGHADEFMQTLSTATRGLVDDDYLLVQANEAMRKGLTQSADQLALLDQIAIAYGRDVGVGAADAVNIMTQAVATASPKMAEQLGLLVKQGDLTAEVNKLLKENAGMTQSAAQQQAFFNLVLKQGSADLAKMGGLTEDAASESEKLAVEFGNLKDRAGEAAVQIGGPLVRGLNDAFDALDKMHAGFNEQNDAIIRSTSSYEEYKQVVGETHDLLGAARSGLLLTEDAYHRERDAILNDNDARRESIETHRDAQSAIEETARSEEQLAEAQKQAEEAARAHMQAVREAQQELNALIGVSTTATDAISSMGVEGWQANADSGQAFLQFLKATNQDLLLTGQALVDFQVKQGMLTDSQAAFVAGQQTVSDFLARYPDQINAAAAAFEQFAVGNDNAAASILNQAEDAEQAGRTYSGLGDAVRNTNQAIDETSDPATRAAEALQTADKAAQDLQASVGPAFDTMTKSASPAEAKAAMIVKDFTATRLQLTGLGDLASSAFDALAQAAGLAASKLAIAHRESAGLREDVAYLLTHSNINLNVNINQSGSLPASGGGSSFYTSGPMVMLVGDNPGGVERVSVTPISGRGVTHGIPGGGMAFGGGTEGMGGTSMNIGNLILQGVQDVQSLLRELEREAGYQGKRLALEGVN